MLLRLPSKSEGDEHNDERDECKRNERFRKKLHRLTLFPFQVHGCRLEEENVTHENDGKNEQAQDGHWCENSIGFFSDKNGAVRDKQDDEDDIHSGAQRIEVRILGHIITL